MEPIKQIVKSAVLRVLHGLVRILLRYDISHSEFAELARLAYVQVAMEHFSIPNRKKTVSRVSVITGLSRKEVARMQSLSMDKLSTVSGTANRAHRVVDGWLQDKDFLDQQSNPRPLPRRNGVGSFEELVKRYSGGITARAVLDELERVGTVSKQPDGTVKLNQYGYLPTKSESDMLNVLANHVADLLDTGIYNISKEEKQLSRFQRQVSYTEVPDYMAEEFQVYSQERLNELMQELNQWLFTRTKHLVEKPEQEKARVGVGMYFFKNRNERV